MCQFLNLMLFLVFVSVVLVLFFTAAFNFLSLVFVSLTLHQLLQEFYTEV